MTQPANAVLSDFIPPYAGAEQGAALWIKRLALVVAGVALIALSAKIKVSVWPSPVPITMQTFAVLAIGAAYGPRLGFTTILAYLAIGALGFDIFTSSSADRNGLAYMMGVTGGYLAGYLVAALMLGYAARRGWDRSVPKMAAAMLAGNVVIYALGLGWLYQVIVAGGMFDAAKFSGIWDQTLAWGLTPFLVGDALKLALAALIVPALWKLIGNARA